MNQGTWPWYWPWFPIDLDLVVSLLENETAVLSSERTSLVKCLVLKKNPRPNSPMFCNQTYKTAMNSAQCKAWNCADKNMILSTQWY